MKKKPKTSATHFFHAIIKYKYIILITTILITIIFGFFCTKLHLNADYGFITDGIQPSKFIETQNYDSSIETNLSSNSPKQFLEGPIELAISPLLLKSQYASTVPVLNTEKPSSKNPDANYWDGFAIVISSNELFSPYILNLISELMQNMEEYAIVGPLLSPFNFVTVEKKGTRLAIVPMNPNTANELWTKENALLFQERLIKDKIAGNYLYNPETNSILLYYRIEHANKQQLNEMRSYLQPLKDAGCIVAVTGYSTISERIMHYLNKDLFTLLALCLIVILIIYYFSFRSFRGILIPLSVSLLGIIWTLGTMAKLGYSLSLVTLLTPCLVLILGSSYSIHMLNEYYYECKLSNESSSIISRNSCLSIFKTIILASFTTIVGFLSLTLARTTAFKEFGISISIGVLYCGILSLTFLPALLAILPKPKTKTLTIVSKDILSKLITKIAYVNSKRSVIILSIVFIITLLFSISYSRVGYDSNYMSYFPQDDEIIQENVYFAQTMGGTDPYYFTIKAPNSEKGYFLQPEILEQVFEFEQKVQEECSDIIHVLSFSQYIAFINQIYSGTFEIPESPAMINMFIRIMTMIKNQIGTDVLDMLINEDATEVTISLRNFDSIENDLQTTASARRIAQTLDKNRNMLPVGTSSKIWCTAYDLVRGNDIVMIDQKVTTIIAMVIVFIIVCLVFKSFLLGLGAMIPVLCGIMSNYIFMWLTNMSFDLVTIGFSCVTIGIGIDDAIHFLMRFNSIKDKSSNMNYPSLLQQTILVTGKPIFLTTISIVAGMMMFSFASYAPIRYFGLVMSIALSSTMLSTLFVLPTYLFVVNTIKNKLKKGSK